MLDMGKHKGIQLWAPQGKSIRELMEEGEIVAIPDPETGMIFKRTARCTPIELMAALTVEEAKEIEAKRNGQINTAG